MSGVSMWVSILLTLSNSAIAVEPGAPESEQISIRPSLAAHLGLIKGQEVVFGMPREFRSTVFDSAFELEPMDESAAEAADLKADQAEEASLNEGEDALHAGN